MTKTQKHIETFSGNEAEVLEHFQKDYHPGIHNACYTDEPFPHDHRRYIETINHITYECFLQDDGQIAFREFREVNQWI